MAGGVTAYAGVLGGRAHSEEALSQIQEVIAMVVDLYQEKGWPLPAEIHTTEALPLTAVIPVAVAEHKFRRVPKTALRQ